MPAYWVLDVATREMVVHHRPVDGTYTDVERLADGVLDAAGVPVAMADLLAFTFPNPEPPRRRR